MSKNDHLNNHAWQYIFLCSSFGYVGSFCICVRVASDCWELFGRVKIMGMMIFRSKMSGFGDKLVDRFVDDVG